MVFESLETPPPHGVQAKNRTIKGTAEIATHVGDGRLSVNFIYTHCTATPTAVMRWQKSAPTQSLYKRQ